jgi:cob(I)alamin adenosyltransferase
MQAEVPKQHAFVLPSGNETMTRCHVCRTICRRAERRMIALGCEDVTMQLMNRISDYLFVLARYVGYRMNVLEETWKRD